MTCQLLHYSKSTCISDYDEFEKIVKRRIAHGLLKLFIFLYLVANANSAAYRTAEDLEVFTQKIQSFHL